MVIEYAQLRGTLDGMEPSVITEIAEYYRDVLHYNIPPQTPFVGSDFNVTRAGVHADGLQKNEEIYNIFDTGTILNRPPMVAISNTSGVSGIAHWINTHYGLKDERALDKTHPLVQAVKAWVDEEYAGGRVTVISNGELEHVSAREAKNLGIDLTA